MPIDRIKEAYGNHKRSAKRRGIPFEMTLEEWRGWWMTDNRWSNRGRQANQYVMARKGDVGPYSLDNIYLATASQNLHDITDAVRQDVSRRVVAKVRASSNYAHLQSERHPRRSAVRTPDGSFPSIEVAAKHFGVTGRGIRYRLGKWPGWDRL